MLHPRILVLSFTKAERDIFVLVHVHNLSLHRHEKQHPKVHQQDRPEHWHIKHGEECHHYADARPPSACQPELELWKTSCKWSELLGLVIRLRECWTRIHRVIERREECNEIVQEEDAEAIRDYKVPLDDVNPEKENRQDNEEKCPPRDYVDGGFIEPILDSSTDCFVADIFRMVQGKRVRCWV